MGRRRTEARREKLGTRSSGRPVAAPDDPVETLIARSRKARSRGEGRRALVLLRQACALDEWRARSWTLLGAHLAREGTVDEAARALNQARWLRARAGDAPRVAVTERLVARLLAAAA
jgi:cytochrome c-type biogenesis protein CcmH/NrfG